MASPISHRLWYAFDGDTANYSGVDSQHATWESGNGNYQTTNTIPDHGWAASFDGSDAPRLLVPVPGALTANLYMGVMVRPTSFPNTFNAVFNTDGFGAGAAHIQFLSGADAGKLRVSISGATPQDSDFPASWPINIWTHLAVMYDQTAKTIKVYADGVQVGATSTLSVAPAWSGGNSGIGSWSSTGRAFAGGMDNFVLMITKPSDADILRLATQEGAPTLTRVFIGDVDTTIPISSYDKLEFRAWSGGGRGAEGSLADTNGGGGGGIYVEGEMFDNGQPHGFSSLVIISESGTVSLSPLDDAGVTLAPGQQGAIDNGGSPGEVVGDSQDWVSTAYSGGFGSGDAVLDSGGGGGGSGGLFGPGNDATTAAGAAAVTGGGMGGNGGAALGAGSDGRMPGGGGGGGFAGGGIGGMTKVVLYWELVDATGRSGSDDDEDWLGLGL